LLVRVLALQLAGASVQFDWRNKGWYHDEASDRT